MSPETFYHLPEGGLLSHRLAHMADLPTYHEAVTPADVVALFKPYVLLSDLPALCRVSTHYWQTFAPLLWEDVLRTARRTGLQPADGEFIHDPSTRPSLCRRWIT